jgi:HlyD family secretion protein
MRQAILAILLVALGAGGYYLYDRFAQPDRPPAERPDGNGGNAAQRNGGREVVALGRLLPELGVISVSAMPGERVQRLNVSEGDVVADEGASLGVLASHELRQVELEGLQAQLAAAQETQKANLHVAEARLAQAQAALQQAEGQKEQAPLQEQEISLLQQRAELARSDYEQLAELAKEDPDLVTRNQLQRQRMAAQAAQSEYDQAVRSLEVSRQSAELAIEAARADVLAAEASLEQTKAAKSIEALAKQVEAAAVQERWARLPAPTTGTVLKIFLRPGEFVTETPILQLADLSRMVCIAEVFEADAKLIELGDEAVLSSSAFAAPFDQEGIRGTVTRVGQLITAPGIVSRDPLARADRNVVEVLVAINPDNEAATQQASALVGLQVNVRFLTAQGSAAGR